MDSQQIREQFLDFFKRRGHTIVPSSSLVPTDPSVLLTTAGMQQFKKYYTGELHPAADFGSKRTATIQKCFRTSDIEEVGDATHLTFFEMLGNFSFQDYMKRDAISWGYELITGVFGIDPRRVTVTVFAGDKDIPFDKESYDIWKNVVGLEESRISRHDRKDNFWGPTGAEGPCGPTTEIYVDGVEVWNIVFNEFYQHSDKTLERSKTPGVDTGMGFERLVAVLQGVPTIFETDFLLPLCQLVRGVAGGAPDRVVRLLVDHLRASIFLIADGVRPSNKEAGYILRRLLRRAMAHMVKNDVHEDFFKSFLEKLQELMGGTYKEILDTVIIIAALQEEHAKFGAALASGLKELGKHKTLSAKDAFVIYETFGLPLELIKEFGGAVAADLSEKDFKHEFVQHQEISRRGAEKKFGGHGLLFDTGELKAKDAAELEEVTRLHTATHLLQQALRDVLGNTVSQKGSDITAERTRFDFSFNRKVTPEEISKVESIVNSRIAEDLPMAYKELPKDEAVKTGALHFFNVKYPEKVKVYFAGHTLETAYSKEFCGGPHVDHTGIIGKFKIIKEEAVASGVRRIRAIVF